MKNFAKSMLGLILYLVLMAGSIWLLSNYVVGRIEVDGPSMNDTLQDQDNLLLNKFSYRFHTLDRYDIVVFRYLYETDTDYIKRVIGLPGETVQIDADGVIYINGEALEEHYGREVITDPGIAAEPLTLGADEYFVLGDNRNCSIDSRSPDVGRVKKSQIRGNIWLRLYPDFGIVH